jgi:hypothetical protein
MVQQDKRFEHIALVGDSYGLSMLLDILTPKLVCFLVAVHEQIAKNRVTQK